MKQYTVKVFENRTIWYNLKGQCHREDGPAVEFTSGAKAWYLNDELHREDGPAIEYSNGTKEWYLNGVRLSEKEFNKRMNSSCEGQPKQNTAMSTDEKLRWVKMLAACDTIGAAHTILDDFIQAHTQHVLKSHPKRLSDEEIDKKSYELYPTDFKERVKWIEGAVYVRDRVCGAVEVIDDEDYERKIKAFKHHRNQQTKP